MASSEEGWAVGNYGTILHYSSGQWRAFPSPIANGLYTVNMLSTEDGWAVGDYGTILHYSGGAWRTVASPTTATLFSVSMVSDQEGWAVGGNGLLLHYSSGTWEAVAGPTDKSLFSVSMVSASEGWAVGWDGVILHYSLGTWQAVPSPTRYAIASVRESYPDRAFLFRKDGSVRACLDPSRMEQVIINLLDNAAKFSPGDAPVEIELGRYGHDEVAISVRDYGRGIPEEHRERIFERFYQAHEERHYGGLGLGLYISSQIVQMHGGTITCEAPDGKGARFVVRLPLGCGNGRDN